MAEFANVFCVCFGRRSVELVRTVFYLRGMSAIVRTGPRRSSNRPRSSAKIRLSRVQKQIYLHFAEAKYLRRSQNTKKPGQTQPESDFIQAKSKIVKGERKRELGPCFPRRILSKTMAKIGKGERNRAGLHAEIAEPHPIFCKDTDKRGQSGPIRILPNESILGFVQDANEPNAKANKFVFCRNKISTTKLKIRKAASPYGNKRRRPAT